MRFEVGFNEIGYAVLMVDDNGYSVACSKKARELLGLNGDAIGKLVEEILPGLIPVHELLDNGMPLLSERVYFNGKVIISNHKPIFEKEKVVGVVSTFQDLNELDLIVQELEATKELNRELETIFNSSYDEIYVTDGKGYTLRVNKAGERFYGIKAEQILGKHVSELEQQGFFSPSITPQVLKTKKRITSVQETKSGQKLIVTANPIFDDSGEITRIVTNSRDITELNNLRQRLEETEKLMSNYRAEITKLRKERLKSAEIIGDSVFLKQILNLVEKVASVDSTVLIEGESGVGKGIIAYKIHHLSMRSEQPFITINCGAIPENLMESELFGYEEGAFTGAKKDGKKGLIELANRGTVFLDEIGEIPLSLQVKLLQVIQERRMLRVGGNGYIDVDARIIAATNQNIPQLIKEKKFREDLYYRLNVVPLVVPPLRQRKEDIPALIDHFLELCFTKYKLRKKFSPEANELLIAYHWPGNVRELENLIERLVVTVDDEDILPIHLPDHIHQGNSAYENGGKEKIFVLDVCPLKEATEELERQLLNKALTKFRNTYQMASALKVNQSTIVRKLHRYGIAGKRETKIILQNEHLFPLTPLERTEMVP